MTISQAETIRTLSYQIANLEKENGILQHQVDTLLRQLEDTQFILTQERALFDRLTLLADDTQRDVVPVEI